VTQSRRKFLAAGGAALTAATGSIGADALADAAPLLQPTTGSKPGGTIKLALSTYSYWHFRPPKVPIETVIDKAAALGVEGVDVLHRQMDKEDRASLQQLKRRAFINGVSLVSLSIHQDFVDADPAARQKDIDHTIHCMQIAHELGIPCMRLNTGRWNTIASFDDLMKARGIEPVTPGHTEDEGFKWCIESIEKVLPKAEEYGVLLALENHWGLARTPEGQLRILDAVKSPWLGALMDTGNFLEDPYPKLEMIAPRTVFVQAKTYDGGGEWYSLDLDYDRIAAILKKVGYHGYVALEFEGKASPDVAVPRSIELLRRAFASS
jgi:L-ribulose-5-phosphate 3-epimerase